MPSICATMFVVLSASAILGAAIANSWLIAFALIASYCMASSESAMFWVRLEISLSSPLIVPSILEI